MTALSKKFNRDGALPCIVNYVWINNKPFFAGDRPGDLQCGIPLHYVDKTIENAKKYPDAKFQIWIDANFLKESATEFLLQSHLLFSDCTNIKIRDLNDLALYKDNAFFSPDENAPIWHRVDMARLIVTDDTIKKNKDTIAVYADFDVKDVRINSPKFRQAADQYGFVLGGTGEDDIENGYFAFRDMGKGGHPLLSQILCTTYTKINTGSGKGRSVLFGIYHRALLDETASKGIDIKDISMASILPPTRIIMPNDGRYRGLSIE